MVVGVKVWYIWHIYEKVTNSFSWLFQLKVNMEKP